MDSVGHESRDRVAWVGLRRPRGRDALDRDVPHGLEAASRRARHAARASAAFGRGLCFCAGFDFAGHRARGAEAVFHPPREHPPREHPPREWRRVRAGIRRGRVPAIAARHGAETGGGAEPAPACPRWVAGTSASFVPPRGRRGIDGASVHTARPMGASRVADTMPTGRVLDVAEAERAGAVNRLETGGGARADEAAEGVAGMAPLTVFDAPRAPPCAPSLSEGDGLFVESTKTKTALARTGTAAASGPAATAGACGAKAASPGDRAARGTPA